MKQILFVDRYETLNFLNENLIDLIGIKKDSLNKFGNYYLNILNNYSTINMLFTNIIEHIKNNNIKDDFYISIEAIILSKNSNMIYDEKIIWDIFSIVQDELNEYLFEKKNQLDRINRLKNSYQKEIVKIKEILKKKDDEIEQYYIEYCKSNLEAYDGFYTKKDYLKDIQKNVQDIRSEYEYDLEITKEEYDEVIEDLKKLDKTEIKKEIIKRLEKEKQFLENNKLMMEIQNNLIGEKFEKIVNKDNKKNSLSIYQGVFNYSLDLPKSKIYFGYEDEIGFYPYNKRVLDIIIKDKILEFEEIVEDINETIKNNSNNKKITIYNVETLKELLDIYLYHFIKNNITLKKCKNCEEYFIPHNKQVYCDNPSPQNPNKSCKSLSDDMRNNKSPVYELYRSNYKTQSSKKRRNINNIPNIEKKFDKWNKLAKEKMKECEEGNITIEEYKKWLKESQDWIKNL